MEDDEYTPLKPKILVTAPSYHSISDEGINNEMKDPSEVANDSGKQTKHLLEISGRYDKISIMSETGSSIPPDKRHRKRRIITALNNLKIAFLAIMILTGMAILATTTVDDHKWVTLTVNADEESDVEVTEPLLGYIHVTIFAPFLPVEYENITEHDFFANLKVDCIGKNGTTEWVSKTTWKLPIINPDLVSSLPNSIKSNVYDVRGVTKICDRKSVKLRYYVSFTTNLNTTFPFSTRVTTYTSLYGISSMCAAAILLGLYVLIGFELVHRTLAAMIASTVAIVTLAAQNEKQDLSKIIEWLDVETLSLLFGMMVLVAILCETGFFDYVAVIAYKMAKGSQWPLITTLCLFTAIISAVLDNVTTILLITPVTIRLSEVMGLDPRHVLMPIVLFSNIGGTATPIGDPPNVIIISNEVIRKSNIDFSMFTQHMVPGVICCLITGFIFIRIYYSFGQMTFSDPPEVVELRHEIDVWKRAYQSLPGYTHEEDVVRDILKKKVKHLQNVLRKKLINQKPEEGVYRASLKELQDKYKIRNKTLLLKSGFVLLLVITMFFCSSVPSMHLSLGWIALFGAILLLILADFAEIESILSRVEWTTLVFFSALFVLMKAVELMGLLDIIARFTENIISDLPKSQQLNAAMLMILWVSAIVSCFIDNIPFTTVMVPVVGRLAESLDIPLQPLVWALAFGACLGGNGSIIGASANVVCAGISEQHGYRFTFLHFFKVGFPMMLVTTTTAMIYLLICHTALDWNS